MHGFLNRHFISVKKNELTSNILNILQLYNQIDYYKHRYMISYENLMKNNLNFFF